MKKYWSIFCSQIQLDSAYTAWYWANSLTSILSMLVYYFFWKAVYQHTDTVGRMSLHQMITYYIIALLLSNYVSGVGNALAANIRNGSVAVELMKPYNMTYKLVAMDLGSKLTTIVRNSLPLLIIGYALLDVSAPLSVLGAVQFLLSAVLGILLGTQFDLLVGMVAFWTINIWGVRILRNGIIAIFSGALIPMNLFPHWLSEISTWLPFSSMIYAPVSIYCGTIDSHSVWFIILQQFSWLVGFTFIVQLVWRIALRKVVIFGG